MLNEIKTPISLTYQWLLSSQVKKTLLFISVLICFCQAFAGERSGIHQPKAFVSLVAPNDLYSLVEVNYPNTELEINYHSSSASNSCKPQSSHGFAGIREVENYSSHHLVAKTIESFLQVWCKQYLFHIYPSHNFW